MKKLLLFLSLITLISCEEVVDVDLSTAPPRLVVDATISWDKETTGNIQTIKLTTTTGYYQSEIPKVAGATVNVSNTQGEVFNFNDLDTGFNTGLYVCSNFIPEIGETYTLTILYNGQTYTAIEKLLPTPSIVEVEQRNDLGFNNDEIGLAVKFNDYPNQINYYVTRFDTTINSFPEYYTLPDEFTQGNIMNALYSNENLRAGTIVKISLFGTSRTFYNYMSIILNNSNGNSPFPTPPVKIRGNITNTSDSKNYALGYFRLSERENFEYIVQ